MGHAYTTHKPYAQTCVEGYMPHSFLVTPRLTHQKWSPFTEPGASLRQAPCCALQTWSGLLQVPTREEGILYLICKNGSLWPNRPEGPCGFPKATQPARAGQGCGAGDPNQHGHHPCDRQMEDPAPVRHVLSVSTKKYCWAERGLNK